jgi:hypothetical protein
MVLEVAQMALLAFDSLALENAGLARLHPEPLLRSTIGLRLVNGHF